MDRLSRAICFATEAFDGKIRKAEGSPAIFHSLEVACIVSAFCDDEDVLCAAILHDVVEDAGIKLCEIEEKFGKRVALLVGSETEEKSAPEKAADTWSMRKEASLKELRESSDAGTKAVWLGDKLSNVRSLARLKKSMGEDMWGLFNQSDPQAHYAYYQAIAKELASLSDTAVYGEFVELIDEIFGE